MYQTEHMNTDDVSLALYNTGVPLIYTKVLPKYPSLVVLLPTASFLIYSSFQDLHAGQLKKSLTNPMTETIDRLWSHPNQKKKEKKRRKTGGDWMISLKSGGRDGRSPRGIMHLNSSAFQSCQGYMDCRFNRVIGISISPLSTLRTARCQLCTLMRQWSRQDFPIDAIRRIGKKPPDMIGLPISKPSRVVLDFFWSCRSSVIADRE